MTYYSNGPVRFGSVSMVTATLGVNDPEIGTVIEEGDEKYIFVYNAGNSQISVGYGATVSATTNYSVTVSSITQTDMLIGVCKHATLTTGAYGWLLTRGFSNFKTVANSSVAAGDPLFLGADGVFGSEITSGGTGVIRNLGGAVGKVMTATGSAGTGAAFFKVF